MQRLQTTALVHEAYMRLAGTSQPEYENRSHFYSVASRIMRQILVDHARERCAAKRGGGNEIQIAELDLFGVQRGDILLRLDDALTSLNESDPAKTHLIEMRYFGGMTNEECAEVTGVSIHTVKREMRLAQAWLRRELER